MAEATTMEERLARVEGRLEEMGKIYAAKEELARLQDLPARMDRLEAKVDRIPWFILASWLTIILALGGIYFQILQVIGRLSQAG